MTKPTTDEKNASVDQAPVPQTAEDSPEYVDAMRKKRRTLRDSLAGAGGLAPGINGVVSSDEDVFGEHQAGDEAADEVDDNK